MIPQGDQLRTARSMYEELASRERETFLCEAREVSKVTIPHLVPPEGHRTNSRQLLPTPWQSLGARGVNNLASKLVLSMFPPNSSFFKLAVLEEALDDIGATPDVKSEIEESLVAIEKRVQRELELNTFRPRAFEAFRHLVVAGNALLHVPDERSWRVFHLDQFVSRRHGLTDRPTLLITKEDILKADVAHRLHPEAKAADQYVELYTAVYWDEEAKRYHSFQEVGDRVLSDSEESYTDEALPWIALRLTTDEDHYGRGIGADLLGDLTVSDSLAESIADGAAIASRAVGLVAPGASVTPAELNRAANGTWLSGNPQEVGMVQADKARDFGFAAQVMGEVNNRLAQAFLLNSAVQRNAERVTAEEIRFVAQELEDALGGVYSNLSQEFQLPLARRMLYILTRKRVLPSLPKGLVSPTVVTGLEALGRGQEFSRLRLFLQAGHESLGPQAMQQYIDPREVLSRIATSLSIDTLALVRTQEEVAAQQQQAQLAELASTLGPEAIRQVGAATQAQQQ